MSSQGKIDKQRLMEGSFGGGKVPDLAVVCCARRFPAVAAGLLNSSVNLRNGFLRTVRVCFTGGVVVLLVGAGSVALLAGVGDVDLNVEFRMHQ